MDNDLPIVAKRRVQARMGFFVHAVMYVVMNAGIIAIWYATGATYPWFMWPLLGWGLGVALHAWAVYGSTPQFILNWQLRKIKELKDKM